MNIQGPLKFCFCHFHTKNVRQTIDKDLIYQFISYFFNILFSAAVDWINKSSLFLSLKILIL